MRKAVMIFAILFSVGIYAQGIKPKMEKEGNKVKATYFHDNGEIAQTGYMVDGNLHGEWQMFDAEGKKLAKGNYKNGKREGTWFFWEGEIVKEVEFKANRIAGVTEKNATEVVSTPM